MTVQLLQRLSISNRLPLGIRKARLAPQAEVFVDALLHVLRVCVEHDVPQLPLVDRLRVSAYARFKRMNMGYLSQRNVRCLNS